MNILFVIDNLGVGGAEKLLINTVLNLPSNIESTIVYLNKPDCLASELRSYRKICLDYNGVKDIFKVVKKLRKIIETNKINIVHAHLFHSTIIARLACPYNVKLIFSVHSIFSLDISHNNKVYLYLEKLTYSKDHVPVFVSNAVKEDYKKHIGIKGHSHVLYNFVEESFFINSRLSSIPASKTPLRLISVGNLKSSKNYEFLINAFKIIKNLPVTLDIYGEGAHRESLEKMLKVNRINNIYLKGTSSNISNLLLSYDLFIMASENEGFCIAVAEAMAIGLPCLLSDIQTFKEVSNNTAVFFDLKDTNSLLFYLKEIGSFKEQLLKNAERASIRAQEFRIERYIENLLEIYNSVYPIKSNWRPKPILI